MKETVANKIVIAERDLPGVGLDLDVGSLARLDRDREGVVVARDVARLYLELAAEDLMGGAENDGVAVEAFIAAQGIFGVLVARHLVAYLLDVVAVLIGAVERQVVEFPADTEVVGLRVVSVVGARAALVKVVVGHEDDAERTAANRSRCELGTASSPSTPLEYSP